MRLLPTATSLLSAALLAFPARAEHPRCTHVDSPIVTSFFFDGCDSPVQICTQGTVRIGRENATTRFRALTIAPGPSPDDLLYTGELVITTREGSVTLHDVGVLHSTSGAFFELEKALSGTGDFKHVIGLLVSQGTATPTGFAGTLVGELCRVDGERHDR
jgi:hypothetical protein